VSPYVILGLLRDGRARHGYELLSNYRARSALQVNPGNFYREVGKQASRGRITPAERVPGGDPRRIPYVITEAGTTDFDEWLFGPANPDAHLNDWLLFADRLQPTDRARCLDRLREDMWLMQKTLLRAREDLLARARRRGVHYEPATFILLRRIKQLSSELEFVDEVRRELDGAASSQGAASQERIATGGRRTRGQR